MLALLAKKVLFLLTRAKVAQRAKSQYFSARMTVRYERAYAGGGWGFKPPIGLSTKMHNKKILRF